MWYLAEIVLAEASSSDSADVVCEACNVVFQAATALEAYRKAMAWGHVNASEPPTNMLLLGVSHLTTIGEELQEGTVICGRFFRIQNTADQLTELVPPPGTLKAIQWEENRDTPLEEMLSPEQVEDLRRAWGQGS